MAKGVTEEEVVQAEEGEGDADVTRMKDATGLVDISDDLSTGDDWGVCCIARSCGKIDNLDVLFGKFALRLLL